jgi:Mg-chelatase subunit ChlD
MKRAACYDVPLWHTTLYHEQREATASAARAAVETTGDARAAGFSDGFMPELFHRLYSESPSEVPEESRGMAAKARAKLHALASELPEFDGLRKRTMLDAQWASLATDTIAEAVANVLPARQTPAPDADAANRLLDALQSLFGADVTDPTLVAELERASDAVGVAGAAVLAQAESLDESAIRTALRRGIDRAHDALSEAGEVLDVFGMGEGAGSSSRAHPGVACELARRVRNSSKLKTIAELAGRLQATARAKRATRSEYARSELVGVEQTGDVARLLPSELGALADPLRTADLVRRLGERSALGYSVRGREKSARGPILVLLDVSGSMRGARDTWAKAVALAIADIARTERRAFGLATFNGGLVDTYLAADATGSPLPLLDILSTDPDGGTSFEPPTSWALGRIADASSRAKFARADVVLVTDGKASDDAVAFRKRADATGVHVFGIQIGQDARGALKSWAHDVASVDDVSRDTEATDLLFLGL